MHAFDVISLLFVHKYYYTRKPYSFIYSKAVPVGWELGVPPEKFVLGMALINIHTDMYNKIL